MLTRLRTLARSCDPQRRSRGGTAPGSAGGAAPSVPAEVLEDRRMLTAYFVNTAQDRVAVDGLISLREAVMAANTNRTVGDAAAGEAGNVDRIRIDPNLRNANNERATLFLKNTLTITEGLTLEATGASISGGDFDGPVLNVQLAAGNNVLIDSAVVRDGTNRTGNNVPGDGGGVLFTGVGGGAADSSASLGFRRGRLIFNTADGNGGAIYARGGRTVVRDVFLARNLAGDRGGAFAVADRGQLTVTDVLFQQNRAGTAGGAVDSSSSTLTVTDAEFLGNSVLPPGSVDGRGGAISAVGGRATVTRGEFVSNRAVDEGGAIYAAAMVEVNQSVFQNNRADDADADGTAGGALFSNVRATVVGSQFLGNRAGGGTGSGGAVYLGGGTGRFTNTLLRGNDAAADGGGLFVSQLSELRTDGTDFSVNNAGRDGGGLYSRSGQVDVRDAVFRQNRALLGAGGGVYLADTAAGTTTRLDGSNVLDNTAGTDGGGVFQTGEFLLLDRVFVSGNVAATAGGPGEGGGLFNDAGSRTRLRATSIQGNLPDDCAGAGVFEDGDGNVIASC